MTERDPDLFKVLIGEIGQDGKLMSFSAKRWACQTELLKPVRELLHRSSAPQDYPASPARMVKCIRKIAHR